MNFRTRDAEHAYHRITPTGRTRPYRTARYTTLGLRSTHTSREYQCSCGHTGWSNHCDLEPNCERVGHTIDESTGICSKCKERFVPFWGSRGEMGWERPKVRP